MPTAVHPSAEELHQFVIGHAPPARIPHIAAHLEACETCLSVLETFPTDDPLVQALRASAKQKPLTQPPSPQPAAQADEVELGRATVHYSVPAAESGRLGPQSTLTDAGPRPLEKDVGALLAPPQVPDELGRLGPYRVLKLLGRGGMGVVFLAEDPALRRLVALKAMLPAQGGDDSGKDRFRREAQAAAAVHHENVVVIHQVGEDRGVPFLAMEYLEGETLQERLDRDKKLPLAEVLRIGSELARGLAAAHAKGLIHRDVKPSNVFLVAGTDRVKVLDFGLVRATRDERSLTRDGAFLGTPAFMAPEQILDPHVEAPADLYSLGCVLYLMSTGKLAYKAEAAISVRLGNERALPPTPRQLDARLPEPFSGLVMQLLELEPLKRPSSASVVSCDLRDLEKPQPVQPRRWLLTAAALFVVLAAAVVAAVVIIIRTDAGGVVRLETDDKDIELLMEKGGNLIRIRDTKFGKEWQLDAGKYTLGMTDDPDGLTLDLPGTEPFVLKRHGTAVVTITRVLKPTVSKPLEIGARVPADNLKREDIPEAALAWPGGGDPKQAPPELVAILGDGRFRVLPEASRPALSPDGRRLAVASRSEVMIFETETGQYLHSFHGHSDQVYSVAFSPDGKLLASAGRDSIIQLRELATGQVGFSLKGHRGPVPHITFSSDGARLASAGDDGTACVWNVANGKLVQQLKGHTSIVSSVAFHPDGLLLATGSWDWTARVWDISTGEQKQLFRAPEAKGPKGGLPDLFHVAFSSDGARFAAANENGVHLWDTTTWKQIQSQAIPSGFVTFSPDGKALLTCEETHSGRTSGTLRLWDAGTGQLVSSIPLLGTGSLGLKHLSTDGKTLAACGPGDCVAVLFDVETGKPRFPDSGHTRAVQVVAFSPDGKWLASGGDDRIIRLWDLSTGKETHQIKGHNALITGLAFLPDGKILASCSDDKTVRLWDVESNRMVWAFIEHTDRVERVAVSPDGTLLASASADRTVRLWNLKERVQVRVLDGFKDTVHNVCFSPEGKLLAALSADGTGQVWDVSSGKKLRSFSQPIQHGDGAAFMPDGTRLLTGWGWGSILEYSVVTGAFQPALRSASLHLSQLDVRRDGRLAASSGYGGAFQLWDWSAKPQRSQTFRLFPYGTWVHRAVFSPDGRYVATGNPDGTIYLFRLALSGNKTLPGLSRPDVVLSATTEFVGHQNEIVFISCSRDGKRAFSGGLDQTARGWDLTTGKEVVNFRHPARVLRVLVTPDDHFLVTSCDDRLVRIWDLTKKEEVRQLEQPACNPWALALSADGREIYTHVEGQNSSTVVFDLATGKKLRIFTRDAFDVAITPDGKSLLGWDKAGLWLADSQKDAIIHRMRGHTTVIRDMAVSPDSRFALTGSGTSGNAEQTKWFHDDCTVRLWDLRTGQELRRWQENSYTRWGVVFSPGGHQAVAGSQDGTIRVYDIATGKELACLESPSGVHGVAVSPDGQSILGGCFDGVLRLWHLPKDIADPPAKKP